MRPPARCPAKKDNGERAIGTLLDRTHAAYPLLRAGKSYIGLATFFGKQFITQYDLILDAGGAVIGVLYVGVDISADQLALKTKIKHIKIGATSYCYFYVVNAAPGKMYGNLGCIRPGKARTSSTTRMRTLAHTSRKCWSKKPAS